MGRLFWTVVDKRGADFGQQFRDRRFTGGIPQRLCTGPAFSAGPMYEWRVTRSEFPGTSTAYTPPGFVHTACKADDGA
jgi:hypothetical protein